ncbi:hypothetical protein E4U54_006573, partial [Claviceps lovelessii]
MPVGVVLVQPINSTRLDAPDDSGQSTTAITTHQRAKCQGAYTKTVCRLARATEPWQAQAVPALATLFNFASETSVETTSREGSHLDHAYRCRSSVSEGRSCDTGVDLGAGLATYASWDPVLAFKPSLIDRQP